MDLETIAFNGAAEISYLLNSWLGFPLRVTALRSAPVRRHSVSPIRRFAPAVNGLKKSKQNGEKGAVKRMVLSSQPEACAEGVPSSNRGGPQRLSVKPLPCLVGQQPPQL
jgi:hypothetical protein